MKLLYSIINTALEKIKSDPECDPAMPFVGKVSILFMLTFLLTAIFFITLNPFNFRPDNGVHWISGGTGIYFDGQGIAYTEPVFSSDDFQAPKSISIELCLKERRNSKNWGPRDIFSFYDGSAKPSLLISQWGGKIYLRSRFEKNSDLYSLKKDKRSRHFSRGKIHFVTVTFDDIEKAIYIDGMLIEKEETALRKSNFEGFAGRLLLGNSYNVDRGWMGELRELALYDRVLNSKEVARHYDIFRQEGIQSLIDTPGLITFYPFNEGSGNIAHSLVKDSPSVHVPLKCISFKEAFFHIPDHWITDFILNIILFIPLGSVLVLSYNHIGITNPITCIIAVVFTCSLLSISIEISQLYIPGRAASIMDVVSNIAGTMLGSVSTCFFKGLRRLLLRNGSDYAF